MLMHLKQYKSNFLMSVEKEMRDDTEANKLENLSTSYLLNDLRSCMRARDNIILYLFQIL